MTKNLIISTDAERFLKANKDETVSPVVIVVTADSNDADYRRNVNSYESIDRDLIRMLILFDFYMKGDYSMQDWESVISKDLNSRKELLSINEADINDLTSWIGDSFADWDLFVTDEYSDNGVCHSLESIEIKVNNVDYKLVYTNEDINVFLKEFVEESK